MIETGLSYQGESLSDFLGTIRTYICSAQEVTVTLTMTGIMAAAHLRRVWGTNATVPDFGPVTDTVFT